MSLLLNTSFLHDSVSHLAHVSVSSQIFIKPVPHTIVLKFFPALIKSKFTPSASCVETGIAESNIDFDIEIFEHSHFDTPVNSTH